VLCGQWLFPRCLALGCGHPVDGRARGLSCRSCPGSSEENEIQTPHPTCSNNNFHLPSTHHGVALETSPEGPTSFGVFHNKRLASWLQTWKCPWLKFYQQFAHLENLLFCLNLPVFQTPLCLGQLRTMYWREREAACQLRAAQQPGRLQHWSFIENRHFGCSGSSPGSCKWG